MFQVFSDGHGLSGLGDQNDDWFLSGQLSEEGFNLGREVSLVRPVFEDVRDPDAERCGLRQERLDG